MTVMTLRHEKSPTRRAFETVPFQRIDHRSGPVLGADEVRLAKVEAYWTRRGGLPVHRVSLVVTDQRLMLIQPVVSYYYLISLPFLLPFALLIGGWISIAVILAAVVLLTAFGPRKLVSAHTLDEIVAQSTDEPSGPLRLFQREVVEISFKDGDIWRLSAEARNVRRATSIETALAAVR